MESNVPTTIHLMAPYEQRLKQLTKEHEGYNASADWFDPVKRSVSAGANFVTMWGEIKLAAAGR